MICLKNHIIELDYVRALAILLIIVAHLHFYINSRFLDKWSNSIAFVGLNLFFMLSGYLLNSSRKINSTNEIIIYIKNRARRIFPLYWLAFILFMIYDLLGLNLVGTIRNTKLILLNIIGLQGLFQPQYTTYGIWFVGVIILYYIVYIFISSYSNGICEIIIKSIIVMILFVLLKVKFGLINSNFFIYYLVFVGGIIAAEIKNLKNFFIVVVYYAIICLSLCIVYYCGYLPLNKFLMIGQYPAFSFICTLIGVFYYIYRSRHKSINVFLKSWYTMVAAIAYSSYSIYLFHTPILVATMLALQKMGIYDELLYNLLFLVIGIPLTFFVGYYIPKVSKL